MNIDLYGLFEFGDEDAVKDFALAHRFAHEAEAAAIYQQYGTTIDTYSIGNNDIIEPWIALMRGEVDRMPEPLFEWLELHNENHQDMLQVLVGGVLSTVSSTDLSQVDLGDPDQMYQWLTTHQQIHQAEQQILGLT